MVHPRNLLLARAHQHIAANRCNDSEIIARAQVWALADVQQITIGWRAVKAQLPPKTIESWAIANATLM